MIMAQQRYRFLLKKRKKLFLKVWRFTKKSNSKWPYKPRSLNLGQRTHLMIPDFQTSNHSPLPSLLTLQFGLPCKPLFPQALELS